MNSWHTKIYSIFLPDTWQRLTTGKQVVDVLEWENEEGGVTATVDRHDYDDASKLSCLVSESWWQGDKNKHT